MIKEECILINGRNSTIQEAIVRKLLILDENSGF